MFDSFILVINSDTVNELKSGFDFELLILFGDIEDNSFNISI